MPAHYQETTVAHVNTVIGNLISESDVRRVALTGSAAGVKSYPTVTFFQIQDETGSINCVSFGRGSEDAPVERSKICARGKIGVYKGSVQLMVSEWSTTAAARDPVREAWEVLRDTGVLRDALSIPRACRTIGVISSLQAAGLKDFIGTLGPGRRILLYPSSVQGHKAHLEISKAIGLASKHGQADVVALIRGGGSREDLACFDHQDVATAIIASKIPVVTGIGHAIDRTLADLLADNQQITPTAAAESLRRRDPLLVWGRVIKRTHGAISSMRSGLRQYHRRLVEIRASMEHDALSLQVPYDTMRRATCSAITRYREYLTNSHQRLRNHLVSMRDGALQMRAQQDRWRSAVSGCISLKEVALLEYTQRLRAFRAIRVLAEDGSSVMSSKDVAPGKYQIVFPDGSVCVVVA